ncbi:MAG: hypothetical protein M1815_002274 [Lichina confinis]|nr:MAG: hypothetical protein M1815_002274 [Lichina confinis]
MSDNKKSAYGSSAGPEASFRRTWDREAYAAKASEREAREREESKARYEARLAGKKYHAPPPPRAPPATSLTLSKDKDGRGDGGRHAPPNNYVDARASRLDVSAQIGKVQMLTGTMAAVTGRRGRGAGFYCEDCDLTFKDNLQWVDHLNSKQHLVSLAARRGSADAGDGLGEVKRATLEDVRERLRYLKDKKLRDEHEAQLSGTVLLQERLKMREEEFEKERELRRIKRRERRRNNHGGVGAGDARGGDLDDGGGGGGGGGGGRNARDARDGGDRDAIPATSEATLEKGSGGGPDVKHAHPQSSSQKQRRQPPGGQLPGGQPHARLPPGGQPHARPPQAAVDGGGGDDTMDVDMDAAMAQMMGFQGFGTTKI